MKVAPIAGPSMANQDSGAQSAQDARARAIAKLMGGAPAPVQSQNNVSPEEVGAIKTSPAAPVKEQELEATSEQAPEALAEEAAPKKDDPLSSQYALLARKEKALRAKAVQQEQAYKAREEALKAKEAALQAKEEEYKTGYIPKSQIKQNTIQALADAEVSYDELVQKYIDNQNPIDPRTQSLMAKMEEKIARLEAELDTGKKSQVEQQTQAYQAALRQIETDVKTLVKTDPAFETVRETNSIKDVVELIEAVYKDENRLLSVEEAAQMVEDELLAQIDKLTKIEKVKSRFQPKPAAKVEAQAQTPSKPTPQQQPMKTLTNANSSTRQLTARERALAAFKGEKIG